MTHLPDVNVLIALIDRHHVSHEAAHAWFKATGQKSWATCPITENGVIRILSHPKYPNAPGSPAAVVGIIATMRKLPGHVFWPDDLSLADSNHVESRHLLTPAQVTDSYLLALARSKGGLLATFDRRLITTAVRCGKSALLYIGDA